MWICDAKHDYIHCIANANHAPGKHVWDWRCRQLQRINLNQYGSVKNRQYQCKKYLMEHIVSVRTMFGESSKPYTKLLNQLKITDRYVTSKRK